MDSTIPVITIDDLKAERTWLIQHFYQEVSDLMSRGPHTADSAIKVIDKCIADLSRAIEEREHMQKLAAVADSMREAPID